jgi:hypothetical protein
MDYFAGLDVSVKETSVCIHNRSSIFRQETGSLTRQWSAAHQMPTRYQMPEGRDVAAVFISWAQKHHWHWFQGRREWADNPFRPADWYPPQDTYHRSVKHNVLRRGLFALYPVGPNQRRPLGL